MNPDGLDLTANVPADGKWYYVTAWVRRVGPERVVTRTVIYDHDPAYVTVRVPERLMRFWRRLRSARPTYQ